MLTTTDLSKDKNFRDSFRQEACLSHVSIENCVRDAENRCFGLIFRPTEIIEAMLTINRMKVSEFFQIYDELARDSPYQLEPDAFDGIIENNSVSMLDLFRIAKENYDLKKSSDYLVCDKILYNLVNVALHCYFIYEKSGKTKQSPVSSAKLDRYSRRPSGFVFKYYNVAPQDLYQAWELCIKKNLHIYYEHDFVPYEMKIESSMYTITTTVRQINADTGISKNMKRYLYMQLLVEPFLAANAYFPKPEHTSLISQIFGD